MVFVAARRHAGKARALGLTNAKLNPQSPESPNLMGRRLLPPPLWGRVGVGG
jgi:hypothetical protein